MPLPSAAFDEGFLRRVFGEYLEMPGLRLNSSQARRLWGLDEPTCTRLLENLVKLKFLVRRDNGQYTRREDGGGRSHSLSEQATLTTGAPSHATATGQQDSTDLVDETFLGVKSDGARAWVTDGPPVPIRDPAKADIRAIGRARAS